jgi:hypothetical protein
MPICAKCKADKLMDAFYPRKGRSKSPYCKPCSILTARERQQSRKQLSIAYKGGCCQRCGYARYQGALEFHHRDPAAKEFSLSRLKMARFERLLGELDKCDLLCANCHREVHEDLAGGHVAEDLPTDQEIRRCPRCGQEKAIQAYYRRRNGMGTLVYCKTCTKAQTIERQQRLKLEAVAYKGMRCTTCSYSICIGAMEFHHRDASAKDFSLSHNSAAKLEDIRAELDKCDLLCANCHREEHARLRGFID